MGILIGMDEAGYGPNLGPLVVAATAWQVDDPPSDDSPSPDHQIKLRESSVFDRSESARSGASFASANQLDTAVALLQPCSAKKSSAAIDTLNSHRPPDLYRILRNIVAKSPSERRVPIADSKALYTPAAGLRHIERGLHAVLMAMQEQLLSWSAIVDYCGADSERHHRRVCWPEAFDCELPTHAALDEIQRLGTRLHRACNNAGVRPLVIRARLVFPEQFNQLVAHFGNKATALSHVTIGLLRDVINEISLRPSPFPLPPSVHAVCDKHGGRNFYTAILQHHFADHWVSPVCESHAESQYQWGPPESPTRVCFRMNGESFLPTALASMTAKYLRELSMRAFNEFWRSHLPELRPTAGYYNDSRRFRRDIERKQAELNIDDWQIWRNR